ncbi:putative ribonuclease H-like domain-containing protein [Tanacetum coccineum]|uniref:Ribonuclease H-like domain-containing protein n=1 Tax=Tanacetum coccineum TaxID=301880 RepID=A0ABQ4XX50_9ASTR
MTQKLRLGFGSTKKACFVCGSYSHLIKDCDFHEKRMAKKSVLQNMGRNTGQREIRPVWNNVQRINHQNKFVPSAVLTRFGRVPVSAAKQSSLRATTSTSTFRPVNTATHTNRVNVSKLRTNAFHKSHSPIRRSFYKPTTLNTRISNEKVNTVRVNGVNTAGQIVVSAVKGNRVTAVKASAGCVWRPKMTDLNNVSKDNSGSWVSKRGNPQQALKNKGIFDSGCSRHMTGNKDFLTDYQDIDGGFVAFGGSARGGKITGKGKIRTDKLDFEDVFFVKELKFNLFSVSQMCDKKNSVLFTETECLVLSPDFKLLDASQVLLRVPRQSNMYSFDLKNVVPSRNLTCLFAKATINESKLWHRRLGHVNFKTMNKLISPSISFMRPFGCPVTILNTLDPLGKFDGKAEEGSLEGYSVNSKAFRVFNSQTKKLKRIFTVGNQTNKNAGPQEANGNTCLKQSVDTGQSKEKIVSTQQYVVFPLWSSISSSYKSLDENDTADDSAGKATKASSTDSFNIVSTQVNAASASRTYNDAGPLFVPLGGSFPDDPLMPDLEDTAEQEPTKIAQALDDQSWVEAMQEELLQFKIQKVWTLVDLPYGKKAIGTKWVYRNKKDEQGIVVRNKARLVAQGYKQEEGIDYDEVFAPVARIEAIRLFLAYASFMNFLMYQMDVKSSFLYDTIEEEALTKDEDGEDVDVHLYRFQVQPKVSHLNAVKKIFRYLKGRPKLGLWYPKDSPFILEAFLDSDYAGASLDRKSTTGGCHFFCSRLISWQCKKQTVVANLTTEAEYIVASHCCGQVLWIQNQMLDYGYNFMQTKIHVDNESAICVVKNPEYHSKIKHIEIRHHFIRDSYAKKLIKMVKIHTDYNVADLLTKAFDVTRFQFLIASICLELQGYLINDGYADLVRMLVTLLILLMFHMIGLHHITNGHQFTMSNRQERIGYSRANDNCPTIYASYIEHFWNTATSKIINSMKQIYAIVDGKALVILESSVRSDLFFNDGDGVTCLTNDEIFENLALMGYEQLSTKLTFQKAHIEQILPSPTTYQRKRKTQNHRRTKNGTKLPQTSVPLDHGADEAVHKEGVTVCKELSLLEWKQVAVPDGHTSGSGEGRMEHTFELTDNVPSTPHDLPLPGGYIPGSDEGRMKLDELITLCTKMSKQVLDLEKEKDAQAVEILNLKRRVKKLERKRKSSISHPRRRKYRQVNTSSDDGLDEEDASKQGRRSDKLKPMFKDKDFEELDDYIENVKEETVDAATTGVSIVSAPVSTAGVTISTTEPRTPPTTTTVFDDEDVTMAMAQTLIKMKEQKAKEKDVAITDVEDSSRIVRPVRSITTLQPLLTIDPKDKGKGVLVEEEPVKIKMRDQGDLQEDDTNAALAKEFDEIQDRIDVDHELAIRLTHEEQEKYTIEERARFEKKVDSSSKPAGGKDVAKEQESAKSDEETAADYEHENKELRMWLTVVSDEEETVDPKILSAKYPIVDWESQNLGNVDMEDPHVYKIIRADGNTSYHKSLSSMLRKFDRQDLVDLYRLVMKRFEDTTPESYNLLLWGDLKVMFEPNAEDEIWSNQQDWTLISWKLYECCGVHTLLMDGTLTSFNMLVEKMYPLIKEMLQKMLNWKLEAEAESTMAFELLKFIKSQLEE